MYQFILGKISTLSADPLASTLADMAPQGARLRSWLAGRTLLARALSPSLLPDIVYGEQGKPAFAKDHRLWFNLSHSGDDIALLVSDEGEVGCDIEVIPPARELAGTGERRFQRGGTCGAGSRSSGGKTTGVLGDLDAKRGDCEAARRQCLANCQYRQHLTEPLSEPASVWLAQSRRLHPYPVYPYSRGDFAPRDVRGRNITSTPRIINPTPTSPCQEKRSSQPGNRIAAPHTRI